MESRWYLKRGQTLENTKIEDRGHALHVGKTAWNNIRKHLDRKKLIAEALQREQDHRKALKESSDHMTKNWENSVENIRKRAEEDRQKRCDVKEDAKMKNYEALRKQQDAIRQKYVEEKHMEAYMNTQYAKELNGALLLGEVIHQRAKQIEFQKFLKEREAESERAIAVRIKEAAEEERVENETKEKEARQKRQMYAMAAKNEMLKKMAVKEEEKRAQIEYDAINNIRADEEYAEYERMKREAKIREMKRVKAEMEYSVAVSNRRKGYIKKEEDEVDEVVKIFGESKDRIHCFRKIRDKELQEESVEKRIKASEGVFVAKDRRDEELDQITIKVMAEKEKEADEKEALKQQKISDQRAEREEDYQNYLLEQEKRTKILDEEHNWEILNRFKTNQVMATYDEEKRKRNAAKKITYKNELDVQLEDGNILNAFSDMNTINVGKEQLKNIAEQDGKFFKYAEEVLNLAKSRGRLTLPIENVIAKYKREAFGETKVARDCEQVGGGVSGDEGLLRKTPGMRQHDPRTDPVYNRCICQRDRLYR